MLDDTKRALDALLTEAFRTLERQDMFELAYSAMVDREKSPERAPLSPLEVAACRFAILTDVACQAVSDHFELYYPEGKE